MGLADQSAPGELRARVEGGDPGTVQRPGQIAHTGETLGECVTDLGPGEQQIAAGTGIGRGRTGEGEGQLARDRGLGVRDTGDHGVLAAFQPLYGLLSQRVQRGLAVPHQRAPHRSGSTRFAASHPAQQIGSALGGVAFRDRNDADGKGFGRSVGRGHGDAVGMPAECLHPHRGRGPTGGGLRTGGIHPHPRPHRLGARGDLHGGAGRVGATDPCLGEVRVRLEWFVVDVDHGKDLVTGSLGVGSPLEDERHRGVAVTHTRVGVERVGGG